MSIRSRLQALRFITGFDIAELKLFKHWVKLQIQEKNYNDILRKRFPEVLFGSGSYADDDCIFTGPATISNNVQLSKCSIGINTYIAPNSKLSRCIIGAYCSIGPDLLAGLGKHPSKIFVSSHPSFYAPKNISPVSHVQMQKFNEFESISIGNDVWIGARVTIVDGISIGDGAIVAAGAVVTKDVEPYSLVGGTPAKEIRKRFTQEQISFLLELQWWEKDEEWIKSKANLFDDINRLMDEVL